MQRWQRVCLAAAVALPLGACARDITYVDPVVDYQDDTGYVLEGEPRLEFGYYHEQLYVPLADGDECTVVPNPQGGFWTSPSIRAGGIGADVGLRCTLTMDAGEQISDARERRHLVLSPDGLIEATNFPMFLEREDPDATVEDLYGQSATLACTLTDEEERSADLAVECTLAPGTG